MLRPYDTEKPLLELAIQLETGRDFARAGEQAITDCMLISKGITLPANAAILKKAIRERERILENQNTWSNFKFSFQDAHRECREITTIIG